MDQTNSGYQRSLIESDAFTLMTSSPAFKEAVLEVERSIIDDWAASEEGGYERREQLWLKLQVFREVLTELDLHYTNYTNPVNGEARH